MDLEKNKQRLEIIAAQVEELKRNGGGGGTVDAYTKAEADNKFAEKTNVYTKTEADNKFVEQGTPIETDLTPVNIGNYVETFPEEYRYLLQKRLPFNFIATYPYSSSNWHGSWSVVSEDSTNYYCGSISVYNSNAQTFHLAQFSVNKSTWAWSVIRPDNLNSILIPSQLDTYIYGYGNIKTIPSNSDLNSLTYGRYYCIASTAATLTNCPTTDGFQLLHYSLTPITPDYIIQQITTFTANPIVYRRTKTSGNTWNPWYKFEGTVVS